MSPRISKTRKNVLFLAFLPIAVLLIFALIGCNRASADLKFGIVRLQGTDVVNLPLAELIDSVGIQILVVPDSVFFGTITTIKKYGRHLLLSSEYGSNSLLHFRDGIFIRHFDHIGSGPGEFISLYGFYADTSKNELVIYDRNQLKLVYYDLTSGSFKFERKTKKFFSSLEMVSPNQIIYSTDYSGQTGDFTYLFLTDSIFSEPQLLLNTKYQLVADATYPFNFTVGQGEILYMQPITETLFRKEGQQMVPLLKVDFGNRSFPDELLKITSIEEVESRLASGNYSFSSHLIHRENFFVSFFYYTSMASQQLAIVNLNKKSAKQIKNVSETLSDDFVPWPKACIDGMYVFPLSEDEINTGNNSFWLKDIHQMETLTNETDGRHEIILIYFSLKDV